MRVLRTAAWGFADSGAMNAGLCTKADKLAHGDQFDVSQRRFPSFACSIFPQCTFCCRLVSV
jgi:hypothetical protein